MHDSQKSTRIKSQIHVDPYVQKNMGHTDEHSWLIRLLLDTSRTDRGKEANTPEFGPDIAV